MVWIPASRHPDGPDFRRVQDFAAVLCLEALRGEGHPRAAPPCWIVKGFRGWRRLSVRQRQGKRGLALVWFRESGHGAGQGSGDEFRLEARGEARSGRDPLDLPGIQILATLDVWQRPKKRSLVWIQMSRHSPGDISGSSVRGSQRRGHRGYAGSPRGAKRRKMTNSDVMPRRGKEARGRGGGQDHSEFLRQSPKY